MEKIQIKCSSCGQKFAVSESYKNRTVECGACDHRFKVEGAAIIKQNKKYYPGEKSQVNSDSFGKVDSDNKSVSPIENNELGFQPAPQYNKKIDPSYAQPPSARRTFATVTGAGIIIFFIVIFILGSRPDGMLQNIDSQKRIILAGFIVLLGSCLIISGSRNKIKGIFLSIMLGGSLATLPFVFKVTKSPEVSDGSKLDTSNPEQKEETRNDIEKKIEQYKINIGFRKVQSARKNANDPSHVKALVVRDIGSHTDTIANYFKEELALEIPPTDYQGERSLDSRRVTLFVLNTDISTDELIEMTKKFATPAVMDIVRTQLDVVEVLVDEEKLKNRNSKILDDESNPEFFNANFQELFHISRDRKITALQRLEKVKSSLGRRADIADKISMMINVKDVQLSNEAIRTLNKWAIPEYKLDYKVKAYAEALTDKGNLELPVMEYLVEKKIPNISNILANQWLNSNGHLIWDDLIRQAGSQGEAAIIQALPSADSAHLKAASSVLIKIGTRKSLPALNAALVRAEKEDAKYLKATIDEIKSRR